MKNNNDFLQSMGEFRRILDSLPYGAMIVDRSCTILFANKKILKMLGDVALGALINKTCHQLVCPSEKNECPVWDLGQQIENAEKTLIGNEGKELPVLKNVSQIEINGQALLLESFIDITELKNAEIINQKLQKELLFKAYQEGVTENAISVLHNVGNVLTVAAMKVDMFKLDGLVQTGKMLGKFKDNLVQKLKSRSLEEYLLNDPKGIKMLDFLDLVIEEMKHTQSVAEESAKQLKQNISNISEIISIQQSYSNMSERIKTQQDISLIVKNVLTLQRASFEKRNVKIIKNINEECISLVEKNGFAQVINNLLKNAAEAIDERIITDPSYQHREIFLNTRIESQMVVVEIQDNGIGIGPDKLKQIFDFGYSSKKRGSGFGLYDCAKFLEANSGQITINSNGVNQGALVTILLPFSKK